MENISKMEMASALFAQIYIKTEKKFFGLMTKITYTPTNSPVVGVSLDFSPAEGEKVKSILEAAPSEFYAVLKKEGRPVTTANGNFRLNLCYSQDHQFAALHLQQFSGFEYHSVSEIRFAAGDEAKMMLSAFIK